MGSGKPRALPKIPRPSSHSGIVKANQEGGASGYHPITKWLDEVGMFLFRNALTVRGRKAALYPARRQTGTSERTRREAGATQLNEVFSKKG